MHRIMIVDYDPINLAIMKALLEEKYEVITASSSLQAFGHLRRDNNLDLMLVDMEMPESDGVDVLKKIKTTPKLAEIPVILLTTVDGRSKEKEAIANGVADFVEKPIRGDILLLRVQRELRMQELEKSSSNSVSQVKLLELKVRLHQVLDQFS